ncbi:MAG: hypothetical protein B6D39_00080 [Anaerolineae bacterium UTCFX2]|jgi:thiosulfate/3-mercaptopyruvate sulfurtransferase|nr:sulfurtransferase [Anaerolineales bacterium]OQY95328.1 MAG: hypothetical protein B6D39_00080 [Anaerolineae bacterium UTCFX2]
MTDSDYPESYVNTHWVAGHIDDPRVRLVEIIWGASPVFGKPAYDNQHIPGAIAWDFESDLQDSVRRDVIDQTGLEALFSRSGVTPESTVVLYSGLNNLLATYAFWLLKIYGHSHLSLLDGDRQKWLDEGRQTTQENPLVTPTSYHAREPDWSLRSSREDVLGSIDEANHLLIDARSVEMYSGLDKAGAARGGHIPGAINLAALRETNPDGSFKAWRVPTVKAGGTFKSAIELQIMFDSLGITADKELITYCVRGGLSTHAWFVLTQLLGYPKVREYDRSWAEWGNSPDTPIVTGEQPYAEEC